MSGIYASPALCVAVATVERVDDLFEGWHGSQDAPEATLTLTTGPTGRDPAPPGSAPIAYGDLSGWVSDLRLHLACDRGALWVDYDMRHARIVIPEANADRAYVRDTLWRLVALELARTTGRYYLHGAALVGEGGRGAEVICADGGIGKSTLAAAWLAAGHRVVTDDGAMLEPGNPPQVVALPAAWRLSMPADGWCGLAPGKDKQRFWPDPAQVVTRAPIHRLFFAERAAETAIVPVTASEGLTRLIRQNPLLMANRTLAGGHLDALRTLSETVPVHRLLLGPEIVTDPQVALKLLAL